MVTYLVTVLVALSLASVVRGRESSHYVIRKQIVRQGHLGRSFKGFVRTADGVPQSEVEAYELEHLRRLEVLPGLTGL
jgi:hypothetical protein